MIAVLASYQTSNSINCPPQNFISTTSHSVQSIMCSAHSIFGSMQSIARERESTSKQGANFQFRRMSHRQKRYL